MLAKQVKRVRRSMMLLAIFAVLLGVMMFFFNMDTSARPVGVNVSSGMKDTASAYIMNNEYYTRFNGHGLQFEYAEQTCDTCYSLTFSFKVDAKRVLNSFDGYTAVIDIKNDSIDTARFVRTS
jgi:hypothetical protein